ncbi:MAG TPA: P1 family peptidase, partial [Acidimicrobiia bacterium]|nr:P1 family peptidase [Acidimicrobiia bacterium]
WPTPAGPVPIVVGLVIYDLGVGDPGVRPGPAEGYRACVAALAGREAACRGRIGAGTGATVAKWAGRHHARPGGLGSAALRRGDLVVSALAVVNSLGEAREPGGEARVWDPEAGAGPGEATTIGLVATNARLDKQSCRLVAESAHDGLARAVDPVHTAADGDAFVAAATGEVDAPLQVVRSLASAAVEAAVAEGLSGGGPAPAGP